MRVEIKNINIEKKMKLKFENFFKTFRRKINQM